MSPCDDDLKPNISDSIQCVLERRHNAHSPWSSPQGSHNCPNIQAPASSRSKHRWRRGCSPLTRTTPNPEDDAWRRNDHVTAYITINIRRSVLVWVKCGILPRRWKMTVVESYSSSDRHAYCHHEQERSSLTVSRYSSRSRADGGNAQAWKLAMA